MTEMDPGRPTEGDATDTRVGPVVLAILAAGLVLRIAHLWTLVDIPFLAVLYIDPLMYDEWAQRIAGGQLLSDRPFFLDPLYPYFLGLIYAVFGTSRIAAVAVQTLLGALVPLLVFLSVRRWFDRTTALTATAIAAFYVPAIYFGGLIMKPALAMFLVAVFLWLFSFLLRETRRWPWWVLAGVVFGMACLTRGNLLLVAPVIALWFLLRDPDGPAGWRLPPIPPKRIRVVECGSWVAGIALVLAVPAVHNTVVGGEFILTTANAGANFYIGNNPDNDTGEYLQLPFIRANPMYEQLDFTREAERRAGHSMSDREVSAFWFGESWRWVRDHPSAWLGLLWSKFRAFWGAYEIPDSLDYSLYREYAPVLRLPLPGFGLLAPLFLAGAILALGRPGWPRLLLLLVGAYCLTVVFFFVFSRFRMVVAPALYILAAHGAVELVRRWGAVVRDAARGWRPALVATAIFLVSWVFVNVPLRARTDTWSYRLASAAGLPTRPETSTLGRVNLGLAYARKAMEVELSDEAAEWLAKSESLLRAAIEIPGDHPTMVTAHRELGKVLSRQGRNREAIASFQEAIRLAPGDYRLRFGLGILYRRVGELENATVAFREALELAPRHLQSALLLGETLLELGRPGSAEPVFRHALELAPGNQRAREGLGLALSAQAGGDD